MKIETKRLWIRPFTMEDTVDAHRFFKLPEVMQPVGMAPALTLLEESRERMARWVKSTSHHALVTKADGKVIGYLAIKPDSEEHREDTRELGYALHPDSQHMGYMSEAVCAVLEELHRQKIRYVWACCFQENLPSRALIERCGFTFRQEGTYRAEPEGKTYASYEYCRDLERAEEETQLAAIIAVAQENLERTGNYDKKLTEDLHDLLETYGAKDKEALALWHNTESMLQENRHDLLRCEKARKKPYFGRIDFQALPSGGLESYYVGRVGISNDNQEPLVIDWRAPVASVYYENGIGQCTYEVKNEGTCEIDLKRKRTYEIAQDKLIDFFDSDVVANDELLTKYLAKSKKAVLGEIIGTIQKEQNAIIRKTPKKNIIVQGVAGSGKTTVAMHRISYILYNYDSFRPEDFYIIGSNRILLNYITSVLPDLDVYGIAQMTMEQLFIRLLYEDWDPRIHQVGAIDRRDEAACIKGSREWFLALEAFCRDYEERQIPCHGIRVEKNQHLLLSELRIRRYIQEHPELSMQSKILMLNELLGTKLENELAGKAITYTAEEKRALQRQYRFHFGKELWKGSVFELYEDFLEQQRERGIQAAVKGHVYDVYDLAALAYLYKRIKETDGIHEASHVIIDEAQDFGMMAYSVLAYCLRGCTCTIMGDVSQNIHYGYGLNDWEELKDLLLKDGAGSFGLLKKSYRNTVEISHFATEILRHGNFPVYPVEPIIRHGSEVQILSVKDEKGMLEKAAALIQAWQTAGHETVAVICRDETEAAEVTKELGKTLTLSDSNLETASFDQGVMVLPVEYTKGLEFDAVLLYHPSNEQYPPEDQYVKLLYVAATRALHELAVVHMGDLTELIAIPVSEEKRMQTLDQGAVTEQSDFRRKTGNGKEKQREDARYGNKEREQRSYLGPRQIVVPSREASVESTPVPPQNPSLISEVKLLGRKVVREEPLLKEQINLSKFQFGDVPETSVLQPRGHGRIDTAIRWEKKTKDYMELTSNYGVLRLTPVNDRIIRVQFQRGQNTDFARSAWEIPPGAAVTWSAKKGKTQYEVAMGQLCIRIEKSTGVLQFFNGKGEPLVSEKRELPRQIESDMEENNQLAVSWNYFDWGKKERLYARGILKDDLLQMNQKARYISFGKKKLRMPLLISDRGYGIAPAAEGSTLCCMISMYGTYVYTEGRNQLDYYFICGETREKIMEQYDLVKEAKK